MDRTSVQHDGPPREAIALSNLLEWLGLAGRTGAVARRRTEPTRQLRGRGGCRIAAIGATALGLGLGAPAAWAGVTTELVRQDVTRFVTGTVFQYRVYGGTHCGGQSAIYDYPPARLQQSFGGESVLDIVEFGGTLYSTHENEARVYRLNPQSDQWDEVHYHAGWSYMFFAAAFQSALFATGGTPSYVGLLRTTDGTTFAETAGFTDWLWLPVVFQGRLYLLGHAGEAYQDIGAMGVVSDDGTGFQDVAALSGGEEYQAAFVWQDALYLGTGGWTTARTADDRARIYRFDGNTRTQVLAEAMNGVTSFAAMGGKLYASLDSGWERDAGESRLYESADGITWTHVHTLPDPELRRLATLDDQTLILFGGRACDYGVVYTYRDQAAGPLVVGTTALPAGIVGTAYTTTLEAANGWPPYAWSLTAGELPDGLSLEGATGIVAGTPTTVGVSLLQVEVADALGATAESGELSLDVSGAGGSAGSTPAGGAGSGAGGSDDADGAHSDSTDDDGCGCRTAGRDPVRSAGGLAIWALPLAALAVGRRRRGLRLDAAVRLRLTTAVLVATGVVWLMCLAGCEPASDAAPPPGPASEGGGGAEGCAVEGGCQRAMAAEAGVGLGPGTLFTPAVRGQCPLRAIDEATYDTLFGLGAGASARGLAGGLDADTYDWRRIDSGAPGYQVGGRYTTLEFLQRARDFRAMPILTANAFGGGYVDGSGAFCCQFDNADGLAADWVRYTNVILQSYRQGSEALLAGDDLRVYDAISNWGGKAKLLAPDEDPVPRVQYWEIGNEPELEAIAGFLANHGLDPMAYRDRYELISLAIKAVDPSVKVGPCLVDFHTAGGASEPWLSALVDDPSIPIDFVAYHPYNHEAQYVWPDTGLMTAALRSLKASLKARAANVRAFMDGRGRSDYELLATEWSPFRYDAPAEQKDSMTMALSVVESVFTFAEDGLQAANFWESPQYQLGARDMFTELLDHLGDVLLADTASLTGNLPSEVDWRVYVTKHSNDDSTLMIWGLNFHESDSVELGLDLASPRLRSAVMRRYGNPSGPSSLTTTSGMVWTEEPVVAFDPSDFQLSLPPAGVTVVVAK